MGVLPPPSSMLAIFGTPGRRVIEIKHSAKIGP
jgi:hypothetical protein